MMRDGAWVLLESPVETALDGWSLLERNPELPGGAKFARSEGRVCLRAELWADQEADLEDRIAAAEAGFEVARGGDAPPAATRGAGADALDLAAVCGEAGWTADRHADGQLAVDLEVPGVLAQALVQEADDAALTFRVTQPLAPCPDPRCREALAGLLLRVCGGYRAVRAGLVDGAVRYEVSPVPPRAEVCQHAIAALAVAVRDCFREIDIVSQDVRVAGLLTDRTHHTGESK